MMDEKILIFWFEVKAASIDATIEQAAEWFAEADGDFDAAFDAAFEWATSTIGEQPIQFQKDWL